MSEDRTHSLLELLISVNREVAAALDLRTVLQRLIFASIQHVGGERGSIVVMDDSGKPVDAIIAYGTLLHEHTTQQLRDTVERGLAGWVVQNHKSALVPDTSKDERWLRRADDAVDKSGAKSAICVPLMARERLIGVLTLVHSVPNAFNEEHLELMQAIADQASVAVLNARLYNESQRTARVMTALAEGAATINASLEMSDVWRQILNHTMQALQVETAALALIDNTSQSLDLVFQAATGNNSGSIPGKHVANSLGLAGMVVSKGQGVVASSVADVEKNYNEAEKFEGIEVRAIAVAPILSQGKVIGVLEAINPTTGRFDPDALLVMSGLGSLAGTTIQNAQFMERLQKANKHYRELFEDSIDPILITDWEGKVLEANRHAVTLSEYSAEQLRAISIDQLHEVKWNITGLDFETLKRDEECNYESALHRQGGGTIPVEVYVRRVEFEETDSIQWILRNITERKELNALRNDMISMIYHDLRSPLGNITSSLDMMKDMIPEDEAIRSIFAIADNSTARIQRLVNSLLDINRLESGRPITDHKSIDPLILIEEALRDVEPSVNGRNQKTENKTGTPLSNIWVDREMILRVLINLLENASKFTPVGGRIEIGAQTTDDGFIKFFVRDNGPGIPSADLERIFDKFIRVRDGKEKPSGLGIGLAFCRLAVHGHGGEIWVESEVNKGSTFFITLPIVR